ncbi:MAG: glycoside hydrolase family 47 protein [Luteimonas sp.]
MNRRLRHFLAATSLGLLAGCASLPAGTAGPAADADAGAATGTSAPAPPPTVPSAPDAAMAERVKAAFLHGWNGYKQYAWGHDVLMPLSRQPHDWYGQSLLMTPVDALDTMLVMGLDREADEARELIDTQLSFDRDVDVKHFEIVIRLLGGLLSSYQMTHDPKLLALADDLGTRLLPAFDSPTGLPYVYVNLRTGKAHGTDTNPAEAGTLLLEYGTLSRLTGKPVYYEKAKRALVETFDRRSKIGLVGERFDADTGKWTSTSSHIGARIDSYYEYLWKCWLLFGDRDCLRMWQDSIAAANHYLPEEVDGRLWYGQVDMDTGARTGHEYGALDAFMPGLLAYSGDVARGARLEDSSFAMWQVHGIEPEAWDYRKGEVTAAGYPLRPEIVESAWYLYRATGDAKWRDMGRTMFGDFVRYTRTDAGYAALKSVVTKEQADDMESFVLAETFKYYYLLFAGSGALGPGTVVFNTEAHPLRPVAPAGGAAR